MTTDNQIDTVSLDRESENKIERMIAGNISADVQTAFGAVKGFLQKSIDDPPNVGGGEKND